MDVRVHQQRRLGHVGPLRCGQVVRLLQSERLRRNRPRDQKLRSSDLRFELRSWGGLQSKKSVIYAAKQSRAVSRTDNIIPGPATGRALALPVMPAVGGNKDS